MSTCLSRIGLMLCLLAGPLFGQEHHHNEPMSPGHHGARAPIGVMGDHVHRQGEWMFTYRYQTMSMEDSRDGESRLSLDDVYARGYMIAPLSMEMEMHMFGAMVALDDRFTLTIMLPYVRKEMEMRHRMGMEFSTETEGIGDLSIGGVYQLAVWERHQLLLNLGVSLPTGSTSERHDTPMGRDLKLPYGMQLGSGTVDLVPGLTYVGQAGAWNWGAQLAGTFRLDRNDEGYALGDSGRLTTWLVRRWNSWLCTSVRLEGTTWADIDGQDDDLMPGMSPATDPDRRSGSRLDALAGVSLNLPKGRLKGHRLALEAGAPVYQRLDGPQLETDWLVQAGWQISF